MEDGFSVKPLKVSARFGNLLLAPLMHALALPLGEAPQRTHVWNNQKLTSWDVSHLFRSKMVRCPGILTAGPRYVHGIPAFHIPFLGGWKSYVVLEPVCPVESWHVGWITSDLIGVSQIVLTDSVRVLIGPSETFFFGVLSSGAQISLVEHGRGNLGDGGPHRRVPLL